MKRVKTIVIYAAIMVATLVAGELLARIVDWSPGAFDGTGGDRLGPSRYYHSPDGIGDLAPNQDGHWVIWFHRPYHVQTNSLGLRGTEEPVAGSFRIVVLGDSQTFGPYLANEDTWPAWTENFLRRRSKDAGKVQVFNAAIAGYTISDELALFREKVAAFKPDLVVLGVFENDLTDLRKANGQRPAGDLESRVVIALKVLARSSALVSLANDIKSRLVLSGAGVDIRRGEANVAPSQERPPDYDALVRRYGEAFREMAGLAKSKQIPLAAVFIPSANALDGEASLMEPVIAALARETTTPYLDLTPQMRAENDGAVRFYLLQRDEKAGLVGNGHLAREGNLAIGRAVGEWLVREGLIPR